MAMSRSRASTAVTSLPSMNDAARGRRIESGKDAQGRALAGTGRTEQREELAGRDLEIDALQRGEVAVHLDDICETDLTAPLIGVLRP